MAPAADQLPRAGYATLVRLPLWARATPPAREVGEHRLDVPRIQKPPPAVE